MTTNKLRRRLLDWYDRRQRDLPWRQTREPYPVLVSEVMLQQTQVERAARYYGRFLTRFPSVEALAAAEQEEVLACWSGLGYYRRARDLHRAAQAIVARDEGFPSTLEELARLPGVGPYTAAAVASIAFGALTPAVDANVTRVVARFRALGGPPQRVAMRRALAREAARLLDPARPGDSNQALMELGATVCTPRAPRCPRCPLCSACRAAAMATPTKYPQKRPRRATVKRRLQVVVVRAAERLLLFRRPVTAQVLAGTWELPWGERGDEEELEGALAARYGGQWRVGPTLGRLHHSITYRRLEIEIRRGEMWRGKQVAEAPAAGWFRPEELTALPLSSLVRKVLAGLPAAAPAGANVSSDAACHRPAGASQVASRRSRAGVVRRASRES